MFYFIYILKSVLILECSLFSIVTSYDGTSLEDSDAQWSGNWFPFAPGQKDSNPIVKENMSAMMSILDPACDDGKNNLTVDWDGLPSTYTCYEQKSLFLPQPNVSPELNCIHVPVAYSALHICMNSSIKYSGGEIPTFGSHRSVWPRYGEYKYVPPQRWLHSLEHGAIVMLYHPCASAVEIQHLRRLVRSCLRRHIISAESGLPSIRPLALLSWGCRLDMSVVHEGTVRAFIRNYALHGPERISKDGTYDLALLQPATLISDEDDSTLCPERTHQTM